MPHRKHILFVDDEPHLLQGLQRMLRPQRHEWNMIFAAGGAEALEVLEAKRVDVIVTDMRMPGMDGAALLQQVHDRFPGVLRIVLSGHFDVEAGLRAVPVAHQFIAKPCEPHKLRAAIERSAGLGNAWTDEATRRVVSAIGALPSPPRTCSLLMEAVQDPEVSIEAIGRIVDQDVAITAKILQLVNSAFFGLPREVSSVRSAVNLLGMDLLKQLVLSAGVLQMFHSGRKVAGFSLEEFERHSQRTAAIAAQLSEGFPAPSAAVIAGLLHDTGKLVMATCRPEEFREALARSSGEARPLHECEHELLGVSHAEIGGYLLSLWGLPALTIDAISFHHRPAEAGCVPGEFGLRAVIHLANGLAHEPLALAPSALPEFPARCDAAYLSGLGAGPRIRAWREKIRCM
jgi:HD-like signal output (HDOD) protein